MLATSQRQLGVTGEVVVPVGPLAADEAQALFAARAAAALPSFRLTEDNAAAVAGLCEALEGVPLAVELAAARILVLSPQGILDRLGDRQRLLAKGARDAPARQRSLRASLEASNELCTPDERLLWARLSVFTGGFPLEAAEVVCAGDGIDGADVLDLVDGLLEKSVLMREDDGASYVRFRMLESLREYAAEQLTAEQQQAGRDRHLAWCADLVRAATDASFGPEQAGWYRTLRREHGNLREALRHAVGDPRHAAQALEMVTALEPYWAVTGRLGEARHWLARASAVAEADAGTRARALAMAAWTATLQGEPATGRSMLDEAAALLAGGAADDARPCPRARRARRRDQLAWQPGRGADAAGAGRDRRPHGRRPAAGVLGAARPGSVPRLRGRPRRRRYGAAGMCRPHRTGRRGPRPLLRAGRARDAGPAAWRPGRGRRPRAAGAGDEDGPR